MEVTGLTQLEIERERELLDLLYFFLKFSYGKKSMGHQKVCYHVVDGASGSGVRSLEELYGDFYRDL